MTTLIILFLLGMVVVYAVFFLFFKVPWKENLSDARLGDFQRIP